MEDRRDMQFVQNGRKVFKEVLPLVSAHIQNHLESEGVSAGDLKRLWLHQANQTMNDYIGRKVMGRTPSPEEQPNILKDYANTSSAGSIIAFAIITETVFQWPGVGLLFINAIQFVDIPVMAAYLMLISVMFVGINLIVDLLYFAIDPRLRVDRTAAH